MTQLITEFTHNGTTVSLNTRWDVAKLVVSQGVGIELGTATGNFTKRILETSDMKFMYTVDHYDKDDADNGYIHALWQLNPYRTRSTIIRSRFDTAVRLFDADYFDFIYIDGYAHSGQEDGKTFRDWWPLLKPGGIFAGDDYHDNWPLVVKNLNIFANDVGHDVHVIDCTPGEDWASQYPTWFMVKK